jgi:hypothetical protein
VESKVQRWGSCGGWATYGLNASDPAVCCPDSYSCNFFTPFYWQCQPTGVVVSKPRGTWSAGCTSKVRHHGAGRVGLLLLLKLGLQQHLGEGQLFSTTSA